MRIQEMKKFLTKRRKITRKNSALSMKLFFFNFLHSSGCKGNHRDASDYMKGPLFSHRVHNYVTTCHDDACVIKC